MSITVVGSIAFDSVQTPFGERERMLGGAASHFALAASMFDQVNLVGPVGDDFGDAEMAVLRTRGSNVDDVEHVNGGKTFFWKGRYHDDLNTRDTLDTQPNVFEHFQPKLSEASRLRPFTRRNFAPTPFQRFFERFPSFCLADVRLDFSQGFRIVQIQDNAFFFRRDFDYAGCVRPNHLSRAHVDRSVEQFFVQARAKNYGVPAPAVESGQDEKLPAGVELLERAANSPNLWIGYRSLAEDALKRMAPE